MRDYIHTRNRNRGFSLIELLIVVAIILIITAIAIPNLLRSKMEANQASAVGSLRTLNTAAIAYSTTYGGYPATIGALGGPATGTASASAAGLIDSVLATQQKSGYFFEYAPGAADANGNILTYAVAASPLTQNWTGQVKYYTDETGVIRSNPVGRANASSTPIS